MKVCFFGSYVKDSFGIPSGNGGTLLKKILEKQKVNVIECHEPIESFVSILPAYLRLFFKHRHLDYDAIIIPWRGILTLPLAKLIHKKPIMYFPAFSIYDTLVNDRKKVKKKSIKAKLIHMIDSLACKWSDMIILESTEEINYFVKEFGLPKEKFRQSPLAADETIFFPKDDKKTNNIFSVLFFGSFIPLHGIETIINAATILKKNENVIFNICGDGQTKSQIKKMIQTENLKNVKLLGLVSKDELLEKIASSSVCLGIFGNSEKAKKVVTNKAFQILASKKPLITMKSPASLEIRLENKKNCILIPPSNPQELADGILFLKNNPEICNKIASEGYQNYVQNLSMDTVGKKLLGYVTEMIKREK